jgi:glycosyltransferase involved in cell wall biosynthesis
VIVKFSVLIPIRNRLDNLKNAISSVLLQDYENYEIIISDNDSDEDIASYVTSLNNSRILYFRTEKFISVTENWNRTIEPISGDYVVMLGDDDCLMKGYFSFILKLIKENSNPDLIYSDAFFYAHPGVLLAHPNGYLRTTGNCSYWKRPSPFCLNKKQASDFAEKTMNFKCAFSFNMQYATMRASFIRELKFQGRFFHSPYPDYYAMTLMLKRADKILVCPYPMTIIGITPKSFGFFYFNYKESEGVNFLNNQAECDLHPELNSQILPGSKANTSWLYALACLKKNYPLLENLKINISQYRRLQIIRFMREVLHDKNQIKKIPKFLSFLRGWEIFSYFFEIPLVILIRKFMGRNFCKKFQNRFFLQEPLSHHVYDRPYSSVLEIVADIDPYRANAYISASQTQPER